MRYFKLKSYKTWDGYVYVYCKTDGDLIWTYRNNRWAYCGGGGVEKIKTYTGYEISKAEMFMELL